MLRLDWYWRRHPRWWGFWHYTTWYPYNARNRVRCWRFILWHLEVNRVYVWDSVAMRFTYPHQVRRWSYYLGWVLVKLGLPKLGGRLAFRGTK